MKEVIEILIYPISLGILYSLIALILDHVSKGRWRVKIIAGVAILFLILVIVIAYLLIKTPLVEVPKVTGMDKDQAILEIEKRGLVSKIIEANDDKFQTLQVMKQEPGPGTKLKKSTKVEITVCKGPIQKDPVVDSNKGNSGYKGENHDSEIRTQPFPEIEKVTITHINDLPISHSINIQNRRFTAKGMVISSKRIDNWGVTLYVNPPDSPAIYRQYDEDQVIQWKQRMDGKWEGEWKKGGYIGEEGMHYNMRFNVWAVAVNRDEIENLKNVSGSIKKIRNQSPNAALSEPVVVIKKR